MYHIDTKAMAPESCLLSYFIDFHLTRKKQRVMSRFLFCLWYQSRLAMSMQDWLLLHAAPTAVEGASAVSGPHSSTLVGGNVMHQR